jgi:class 3 adenylate cyclase
MAAQEELSRLKSLLEQTSDNQAKAETLLEILEIYEGDAAEKRIYINQLFKLSVELNEPIYNAWGQVYLSSAYCKENNLSTAGDLIESAIKFFSGITDQKGISACYMVYGDIARTQKIYPTALEYYFKAAEIREKTNDSTLPFSYVEIALTCDTTQNSSMYFKYLDKASKIFEETNNLGMLAMCYSNFGATYYNIDKKLSLEYHLKSLKIAEQIGVKRSMSFSYYWVGTLYLDNQQYSLAQENLEKAQKLCVEISNKHILTYSYISLARLHTVTNDYEGAAKYLTSAGEIVKESGKKRWERALYLAWYELKKAELDYSAALHYYEQYFKLNQEIDNADFTEKMAEVKFKMDIEKKEQEVAMEREMRTIVEEKNKIIEAEKEKSESLLLNILPAEVAEELKEKGTAGAKLFDDVTVLFTDFKDFTKVSERLSPQELVDELHTCFSAFDKIMASHKIEKIKTVGDAYLAVSGLPLPKENHAEALVKAAIEIRDFMLERNKRMGNKTFEVRIGIHSGSVVAGIVGVKKFAYDIWGDTVNTAARMEQNSEAGKVNLSETTYLLVKDKFACEYRGEIEAKNKGLMKMYFLL